MLLRTVSIFALLVTPVVAIAGDSVELTFVDHIKAEMIEQDVFVDKLSDGTVFRVTKENAGDFSDAQVYRTAAPVEHAPMDATKIGPYPAGAQLNFTLGEWLSASGTASLTCSDGKGTLSAEFQNLVPNGVYTMWNFFAGQQLAKFHTYDLPVGAPDGSEAAFTADEKGHAIYEVSFEPCLQGTTPQLMAGLAIAYHSDGKTHGYEPGPMGNKSHVQLFTAIPPADG
ncbi:MAG: hypothetical protein ACR2PF_04840 [Rhizobiaceae bacterium]